MIFQENLAGYPVASRVPFQRRGKPDRSWNRAMDWAWNREEDFEGMCWWAKRAEVLMHFGPVWFSESDFLSLGIFRL